MVLIFAARLMIVLIEPGKMDYGQKGNNTAVPRVEEGLNTSTAALRVAEGDEKGNPVPGGTTGPTCHWGT
jgi:hypothetical protein